MQGKTTYFYPLTTLKLNNTLLDLSTPKVMGILNSTPDSFYDGGKFNSLADAIKQTEKMIDEGADIIDIGGMSTRPGAEIISAEEELQRVIPVLDAIKKNFPSVAVSIDTVHAKVAHKVLDHGADMLNDISAGNFDTAMYDVISKYKVPFVIMHMQGVPKNMQEKPQYNNVVKDVFRFFLDKAKTLASKNIHEIIIDPGFGFGKTVEHNFALLNNLQIFKQAGLPILVGISRKSMVCKVLKINADKALNGTTALHAVALLKGANILRVHDVKEAKEVITLIRELTG